MNIKTIEDLAKVDKNLLIKKFGKFGKTMWEYANGIDESEVVYTYQKPKNFIGKSINDVDVPNVESYKSSLYGFTLGAPIIKNKLFFFVNNILITKQPFRICPRRLFYFLRRDPS